MLRPGVLSSASVHSPVRNPMDNTDVRAPGVHGVTGPGSMELPPWQVVRQGLLALPFRFGAAVTHRLLQVRALLPSSWPSLG